MLRRDVVFLAIVLPLVGVVGYQSYQNHQRLVATAAADATGIRAEGFSPAPGFFVERDLQYVGSVPHCIVRLTRQEAIDGVAAYSEVVPEWCEGLK